MRPPKGVRPRAAPLIRALIAVWGLTLCAVLASYGAAVHPIGDSIAAFRLPLLGPLWALSSALGAARHWRLFAIGAVIGCAASLPLALAYLADGAPGTIRIYQKNLLMTNPDLTKVEADMRAAHPDIVTLQEVSPANLALLAALSDILPQQKYCRFGKSGGVAIATRYGLGGPGFCAKGMVALPVAGPQGSFWVISVHLTWPWPYGQADHLRQILPQMAGLDGPLVVAGDFNAVTWSRATEQVRQAAHGLSARPLTGTYQILPWVSLPIDQIIAPGGGTVEPRPLLGSDPLGLLATLSLIPPP